MNARCGLWLLAILWCTPARAQAPGEITRIPDQPPGLAETFRNHKVTVGALAFSPDGRYLASGGGRELRPGNDGPIEDFDVRIWDLFTRQRVFTIANPAGAVRRLIYSPDGRRIAALIDRRAEVVVWDASNGERLTTFSNTSLTGQEFGRFNDVDFLPGNRMIAAGNGAHYVIDLAGPRLISEWSGSDRSAISLAALHNSTKVLSGASDRAIRLWDMERGMELRHLVAADAQIEGLRVTPDGRWFVSRTVDNTIQVWDLAQGEVVYTLPGHLRGGRQGRPVAITPDGSRLLYTRYLSSLIVASATTGREYADFQGHTEALTDIVVHPSGEFAATASYDGLVKLWRLPENRRAAAGEPVPAKTPVAAAPPPLRPLTTVVTPKIPTRPVNAQAERNAAEWLVKIGAEFSIRHGEKYDYMAKAVPQDDGFAIESIKLTDKVDFKEDDLKLLAGLQRLSYLSLYKTKVTGAGLAVLAECSQLSYLDLSATLIDDEGLKVVGTLTNLKTLVLHQATRITDQGLAGLAGLSGLTHLRVRCEGVTGSGFAALPGLTNLEFFEGSGLTDEGLRNVGQWTGLHTLVVFYSPVTDAGLEALAGCKKLRYAIFPNSRITGTGFAALKDCDQITSLTLDACPVTAEGLQAVGKLSSLQELKLANTGVKDEMLVGLKPLQNLHTIHLSRTPITAQAIESLEAMAGLRNIHIEGTRVTAADRELWLDRLPGRQITGP